jgi:hypothetical protein
VSSTVYGHTVDKDTERKQIKCTWLLFLWIRIKFSAIKGNLNGINPEIRVQQLWNLHLWLHIHGTKAGLPLLS